MDYHLQSDTKRAGPSLSTWAKKVIRVVFIRIIDLAILSYLSIYYIAEALILTLTPGFLRYEKSLQGKVVLVTGGAGGVGQELVTRLARENAKVVIWDVNEKALEKTRLKLEKEGLKVYAYSVDVTDREMVYKYAAIVKADLGPVDVLINNAGIVCGQTLLDIPDYMIEKTYKVNILSHYWTTKAFLPDMLKNEQGHIVTVGSLTGLLGTYRCTDYSATKHATVGFHESLLVELKTHGHDKINLTLICPSLINTGMFDGCKPKNFTMLEPREVAKRMITAIKREEILVTLPESMRYILPLKYYMPTKLCWEVMYRVIQGPQMMMGLRPFHEVEAA